jgi:organic radical activating enzyme
MKGGTRMTISDILDQLPETMPHVVITGGEPTLYDLDSLIENLKDHPSVPLIQLETSGQNELKGSLQPDIVTISPKHRLEYMVPDSLARIAFEFKFVVDEHLTEEIVDGFEREYRGTYIVLMPEGCPPAADSPYVRRTLEWLVKHPTWHYGDRLQYRLGVR